MNVTVDTRSLMKALQVLRPAVPAGHQSVASLTGIYLHANGDGRLQLRTSNLDTTIETSVRGQVDEPGVAVVSFRTFAKLVRGKGKTRLSLADGELQIEPVITIVGTTASLTVLPFEGFPPQPTPPKAKPFILPLDAIRRALPAASDDEARPILCMILFDGNEVVATDSYRLHREVVPTARFPRFLLPREALELVLRAEGPITASIDFHRRPAGVEAREADKIELRSPDGSCWHITPSRWGGDFPNYKALIPKGQPFWLRFNKQTLLDALADVSRFISGGPSPARFDPQVKDGQMHVGSQEVDRGKTLAKIDCVFEDDKMSYPHIAFRPDFLADAARSCPGDEVHLGLLDSLKPAVILGADEKRFPIEGLRLLMPVRI